MIAGAIVVAAGQGRRMAGRLPKQFLELGRQPILARSLGVLEAHPRVHSIVVVGPQDWLLHISSAIVDAFRLTKVRKVVAGGKERQESVLAGFKALEQTYEAVLIHDGVRPLLVPELVDRVLDGLTEADACIPAIPCPDTVKAIDGEWVTETVPRDRLRLAQTPQAFRCKILEKAFNQAGQSQVFATDEAGLVERIGGRVRWVEGDARNLKITTALDLKVANFLLEMEERKCV